MFRGNKVRRHFFLLGLLIIVIIGFQVKVEALTENVDDWNAFRSAVSNNNVDKININSPITAGAALSNVSRELEIDGNNNLINFGARTISVASGGIVTVSNMVFKGTGNIFGGSNGEIILKNTITATDDNTAALANVSGNSTVKLDNANLTYSRGVNTNAGIISTDFTVTNNSRIESTAISLYESKSEGGKTIIDKGSKINAKSYGPGNNTSGQIFKYNNRGDIFIKDKGTVVNLSGNVYVAANDGALFTVQSDDSSINVLDGAKMDLLSERTTALLMYSKNGVFNVKNGSELNFVSKGNNNTYGGTIRFRIKGNNIFNIENESKISILKTGENNASNSVLPPAIRMSGENNKVFVKGNSEFKVINKGNGTDAPSGNDTGNQGLLYNKGAGNEFIVEGENSSVDIQAKHGAAIDAKSASIDIDAREGTYFVTRGVTPSQSDAIFSAGIMDVTMVKPKFFDFASKNSQVFDNASGSKMVSTNSDLSAWKKGTNSQGNPYKSWSIIDYSLSNTDFDTINSSNDADFLKYFNRMSDYSRITGNNQSAKVTSVRVPTDADKYIHINVMVPEGKNDEDRPAFDDEVGVRVGLYDANGQEIKQLTGRTSTQKVYDDPEKMGVVKIPLPNNEFFKSGMSVKVLSAWRGSGNENSNKVHMSRPEDITAEEVTAIDVTPPNTVTLDNKSIDNGTKKLSGTSDQDGSRVFFKNNGNWLKNKQGQLLTTIVANGKWEVVLPIALDKNTDLEIYAKEDRTIDKSKIQYQLPSTYTNELSELWGNLNVPAANYSNYKGYHDAVGKDRFAPAFSTQILDAMPPKPKINKIARALTKDKDGNQKPQTNYDTEVKPEDWQGNLTKVNNTLSYRITVQIPGETGKETEKILYNANITDKLPDGLNFDKDKVKVWKYKKGDGTGLPFRYEKNVDEAGARKYNLGDIDLVKSEATEFTEKSIVDYQADTRMLTVGIGDTSKNQGNKYPDSEYEGDNQYGYLLPGDKVVIEVPTTVTAGAVKTDIHNKAKVTGYAGVIATEDPLTYQEITAESNDAVNPGGKIVGELLLVSAPEEIKFGSRTIREYDQEVGSTIDNQLIVKDSLRSADWKVSVKLISDMANVSDPENLKLKNSLYIKTKSMDKKKLITTSPVDIYTSDLSSTPSTTEEFNISQDWSANGESGVKLKAANVPYKGKYRGKVEWSLTNTQ